MKKSELSNITAKLHETTSTLNLVEAELQRKQTEVDISSKTETPSDAWKEKLKLYDEIDKSLDNAEDRLKTKKIEDPEAD